MDNQKPQQTGGSLPWILLVATVGSSLVWFLEPLKSIRPADALRSESLALGDQQIEARLWQDPFEAAKLKSEPDKPALIFAQTNAPAPTHSESFLELDDLRRQIRERWEPDRAQTTNRVTLLPVMVTGNPYADGAEWRVRLRYAVLSGLSQCGRADNPQVRFVPADREHLGCFKVPWLANTDLAIALTNTAKTKPANPQHERSLVIPYEWLERYEPERPAERDSVLVLWLPEEAFEFRPLLRLAQLIQALREAGPVGQAEYGATNAALPLVKVIGPFSSATLREMLREPTTNVAPPLVRGVSGPPATVSDLWTNVELYSPFATAANWRLDPKLHTEGREAVRLEFKTHRVAFRNVTCTDDQLAGTLLAELKRRGIDPQKGARVVLLAEWDTFYGRALPQSFLYAATNKLSNAARVTESIQVFSYLRGLDGKRAHETEPQSAGSSSKGSGKEKTAFAELERPEGNSQLDYARRLAWRMKDLEAQAARKAGSWDRFGHRFQAIGVLGSDVYDKLVLVQALRDAFPEALFFTTDLDARLTHPSQLKWCRNMVIASSFGLNLGNALQGDIPPFRDSYQTACFLATQMAMSKRSKWAGLEFEPRVFEIGQNRPVDLSPSDWTDSVDNLVDFSLLVGKSPYNLHPVPVRRGPGDVFAALKPRSAVHFLTVGLAVIGIVCGLTWGAWGRWLRRQLKQDPHPNTAASDQPKGSGKLIWAFGAIVAILGCVLTAVAWRAHLNPGEEPFSLVEGISVWPAEFMRCLALLISVWFLLTWCQKSKRDETDIKKRYLWDIPTLCVKDLGDLPKLAGSLKQPAREVDKYLEQQLSAMTKAALKNYAGSHSDRGPLQTALLSDLNQIICGPLIYDDQRFAGVDLGAETLELLSQKPAGDHLPRLNRLLLQDAYPEGILARCSFVKAGSTSSRRNLKDPTGSGTAQENRAARGGTPHSSVSERLMNDLGEEVLVGETIVREYVEACGLRRRAKRLLPWLLLYVAGLSLLMILLGFPMVPYRGDLARYTDKAMLVLSIVGLLIPIFLLVDSTWLCHRLIAKVVRPTEWKTALDNLRREHGLDNTGSKCLEHWIDMRVIADCTASVGRFIQIPFLILLVMILSRNPFFDRWEWPVSLVVVMGANFVLLIGGTLRMRWAAEHARSQAIFELTLHRLKALELEAQKRNASNANRRAEPGPSGVGAPVPEPGPATVGKSPWPAQNSSATTETAAAEADATSEKEIELMIRQIEALDAGAFAPLARQPIFGALLMPFGGAAILAVLDYLATAY